jgi:hypothetical protein
MLSFRDLSVARQQAQQRARLQAERAAADTFDEEQACPLDPRSCSLSHETRVVSLLIYFFLRVAQTQQLETKAEAALLTDDEFDASSSDVATNTGDSGGGDVASAQVEIEPANPIRAKVRGCLCLLFNISHFSFTLTDQQRMVPFAASVRFGVQAQQAQQHQQQQRMVDDLSPSRGDNGVRRAAPHQWGRASAMFESNDVRISFRLPFVRD